MMQVLKTITPIRALSLLGLSPDDGRGEVVKVDSSGYGFYLPAGEMELLTGKVKEDAEEGIVMPGQSAVIKLPNWVYNPKKYLFLISVNPALQYTSNVTSPSAVIGTEIANVVVTVSAFKKTKLSELAYLVKITPIQII